MWNIYIWSVWCIFSFPYRCLLDHRENTDWSGLGKWPSGRAVPSVEWSRGSVMTRGGEWWWLCSSECVRNAKCSFWLVESQHVRQDVPVSVGPVHPPAEHHRHSQEDRPGHRDYQLSRGAHQLHRLWWHRPLHWRPGAMAPEQQFQGRYIIICDTASTDSFHLFGYCI